MSKLAVILNLVAVAALFIRASAPHKSEEGTMSLRIQGTKQFPEYRISAFARRRSRSANHDRCFVGGESFHFDSVLACRNLKVNAIDESDGLSRIERFTDGIGIIRLG